MRGGAKEGCRAGEGGIHDSIALNGKTYEHIISKLTELVRLGVNE
jgi:hypothetical protein